MIIHSTEYRLPHTACKYSTLIWLITSCQPSPCNRQMATVDLQYTTADMASYFHDS